MLIDDVCASRKNNFNPVVSRFAVVYNRLSRITNRGLLKGYRQTAKRKIARSRLPLQRHLGLETEGRYLDLRSVFDKINSRHFTDRLRG